ncbi:MAG: sulfatase-like hydrolase/transferase [bacterium]
MKKNNPPVIRETSLDFLSASAYAPKKISALIFIIFFIVLNVIFSRAQAYRNVSALSRSEYYSNLGVYGYLFNHAGEYGKLTFKNFLAGKKDEPSIQSDMDIVKENLMELAQLNSAEAKQIPIASLNTPHIIIYQMESVDKWALKQNPSPMPFLQKLLDENISTEHFFSNSCTTINAEFSSVCSFYPESSGPISDLFAGNNYYCLPTILKERYGYATSLYHANSGSFWNRETLAPKWGYNKTYFSPYFKVRETDGNILADMVSHIKNSDRPTFNYIIGFTSHCPHNQDFINFNRNENNIEIAPYPNELNKEILPAQDEETIRNYLGFLTEIDNGIKNLFSELEKNGLMKNTIVILYGDHRYYSFNTSDKTADFYNYNEVPFVMYVPNRAKGKIKYIASQIDIAPTILNILEGENFSPPENFIGKSVFSKTHPESAISKCLGETLYVDKNIILKNDMLIGIDQPIAYLDEYAEEKLKNYEGCLSKIIEESDKIITENILCGGEDENEKQLLNFEQETDSDKDGLSDLREKTLGTDRLNPDTDGDGFIDGVEVINGFNPFGKGLGILKRIPRGHDTDNDGLPDEEEIKFGTDINNPDTDGDGYLDGGEVIRGYNPMGEGGL